MLTYVRKANKVILFQFTTLTTCLKLLQFYNVRLSPARARVIRDVNSPLKCVGLHTLCCNFALLGVEFLSPFKGQEQCFTQLH